MQLTSPAFHHKDMIPKEYTCDGADLSPELQINDIPEGTETLALICDDPDAPVGLWVHWVMFNIPSTTILLPKGLVPHALQGAVEGMNTWEQLGYGGPCPPSGTHRYFFKLYALDTLLDLPEGSTNQDLEQAMQGHVLDEAILMGRYARQK